MDRAAIEADLRAAATEARWRDVATSTLHAYGDELLGYLVALTRDRTLADEAFGQLLEDLWVGLPAFRWECSMRTWAYTLARNAVTRNRRGQARKKAVSIDAGVMELAAELQTRTATFLKTESRDRFAALRATLEPDDQTLLILRINRGLAWRDIARILPGPDGEVDDAAVTRRAATLRKHFERLKDDVRARLRAQPS